MDHTMRWPGRLPALAGAPAGRHVSAVRAMERNGRPARRLSQRCWQRGFAPVRARSREGSPCESVLPRPCEETRVKPPAEVLLQSSRRHGPRSSSCGGPKVWGLRCPLNDS